MNSAEISTLINEGMRNVGVGMNADGREIFLLAVILAMESGLSFRKAIQRVTGMDWSKRYEWTDNLVALREMESNPPSWWEPQAASKWRKSQWRGFSEEYKTKLVRERANKEKESRLPFPEKG